MSGRPARRCLRALGAAAAAVLLPAAALAAQDPVPRDTLPPAVEVEIPPEAVRADTLPDEGRPESAAADSLRPAPNFPRFPPQRASGFAPAVWVFGPRELGRFHGLTLLELLDRIPGIPVAREGDAGRPAGVAPFGGGGGRLRLFLDGWEIRALSAASPELQHVPLVDVEEVRVTRGLAEVRVDVTTFRPDDARPYAQIEGGEGDYGARLLRGLFVRPFGRRLMVHAGVDITDTQGYRRLSPFSANTALARVSWYFGAGAGVQLDYRSTAIDTERTFQEGIGAPRESFDRGELVLRGRGRVAGGLWLDGAVGRSWTDPQEADTVTLARESAQGMLRAALDVPLGTLAAAARVHRVEAGGFAANATELSARADLTPSPNLAAWGEARALSTHGVTGVELEASGRLGPWRGVALFGSVAGGARGLPFRRDTLFRLPTFAGVVNPAAQDSADVPVVLFRGRESRVAGFRAGVEGTRGSGVLGAAFVAQDLGDWVPYGFWYDRGAGPVAGATVGAVEGYASLPLFLPQLRLDAHYTDFLGQPLRPYVPARFGRAAVEFHWLYRGGALEPTLRAEVVARDRALAFDPQGGELTAVSEPYAFFNLFVQVRVLDVRAFWRMENVANRSTATDVPGLVLPGNRAMFGVRWFFRD